MPAAGVGEQPLVGVRIIDFTQVLAGPFCTMLLADLGADVIKVETPDGDPTRGWGPFRADDTERSFGGYFASINRNKRSLSLDLKSAQGRGVLLDLLDGAHVLVQNFRVGVMERLGLGYEELHQRFPRLVYASISGFGDPRTGASPYADWPAFDIVAQAMGGLIGITGPDADTPVKAGPGVGDIYPATLAAVGVLAALHKASATGLGDFVDVAMYDGVLALCERIIYQQAFTGEAARPQGNTHPFLCPYGLFRANDGWVTIAAPTDRHWSLLATAMGREELGADVRFATNPARVVHMAEVLALVSAWTERHSVDQVIDVLSGHVPCGPVNSAAQIIADPHVAARRMVVDVEHPGTSPVSVIGSPIKFAGVPDAPLRRAPLLGEDSVGVLRDLGYEPARIEALTSAGVIVPGQPPAHKAIAHKEGTT